MALRTSLPVQPHLYIGDVTGVPLDYGMVYFGEPNKDPEFYPIDIYYDEAMTVAAAQPVRTKGGFMNAFGDMVEVYAKEIIYSVKVLDSYGRKVFYKGAMMRNSWNDDVIEQINTAIIGSADAARQVAIDITNDAINNTAVEGGVLADTFVTATANGVGSVARTQRDKNAETISVLDFGAVGDGVTDDFLPIKRAVEYVNSKGGILHFPKGHYYTVYRDISALENWIEITSSGVRLQAEKGSVTLENFLIYVHGEYEVPQRIGDSLVTTGDRVITSMTANTVKAGDYVQLLSGINPYTPDAGEFQLGSKNPTSLTTPNCRFSEIHKVYSVESSTSFTLYDDVIYPNYKNNTTGQSHALTGVSGAEFRKITPVIGVTFDGLTFKNVTKSSFREIIIRAAVDVAFIDCHFEADKLAGVHVKSTDTLGLKFLRCTSYRDVTGYSGSSWNSFLPAGGCQEVAFEDCRFVGEAQTIDFSPNSLATDIGATSDQTRANLLTTQHLSVVNCTFINCGDGATTHPATYRFAAHGNKFYGCSTGLRVRSLSNSIIGNVFQAKAVGISLSAFYRDTLVVGNTFSMPIANTYHYWLGISFTGLGSETMNSNDIKDVSILSNTFVVSERRGLDSAISFRNAGDGVPANPAFDLFTDAVKTRVSDFTIKSNTFRDCSVYIGKYFNGVNVVDNDFAGVSGREYFIESVLGSARNAVRGNSFAGNTTKSYLLSGVESLPYSYETQHRVGLQYNVFDSDNTNVIISSASMGNTSLLDGLMVANGAHVKSVRSSGGSVLNIDAEAQDGTSNCEVRVFIGNESTGSKTMSVYGSVMTGDVYPSEANTFTCGKAHLAWSGGHTQTAFSVTSDEREKQGIRDITEAEARVARKLKGLLRAFKYNNAVEEKGDKARTHVGVIAQDVITAFNEEGLNAYDYALLCHDTWDDELDEDGNILVAAGERFSIRYEELLSFIISAL